MESGRWKQIKAIHAAALDLPRAEHSQFLRDICQGDSDLYEEVDRLLGAKLTDRFLERTHERGGAQGIEPRLPLLAREARTELSPSEDNCGHPTPTQGAEEIEGDPLSLPRRCTDRYEIIGEYARGGMGRILEAFDRDIGRRIAIKELLHREPSLESRIATEALITARLQHPGIVPVYDVGVRETGQPFYAMKLLTGESLRTKLSRCDSNDDRLLLLPRLLAAAKAMAYAHSKGIIHRDIKPSNIMVGDYGDTVVIDWGLAKDLATSESRIASFKYPGREGESTKAGTVLGTPGYMAPEQRVAGTTDERADVYALGAILHEILSGSTPSSGNGLPDNSPHDLVTIASTATQQSRNKRHASAVEFSDHLERFVERRVVQSKACTLSDHTKVYSRPRLYEVGFSYRDIPAECEFLRNTYRDATGSVPASFLDVAAGPASHGRWFARQGVRCSAIDSADEMVRYGADLARKGGASIDYRCADMTDFGLDREHDLAACMLDSFSYLHSNEDVLKHLRAMAKVLRPGGIYIVELSHPADLFRRARTTRSTWEVEDSTGAVGVRWQPNESTFDTITQIIQCDVEIGHTSYDGTVNDRITATSRERMYTYNEIDALVRASGLFRIASVSGALAKAQPLTPDSWRMVPVLERL